MKRSVNIVITILALFIAVSCGNKKSEKKASIPDSAVKANKPDTFKDSTASSAPPLASKINSATETNDYKITAPTGWVKKESEINGLKMFFLVAPKTGDFQSNLNILKDKMNGVSLDEYVSNNLKKMASMQVKRTGESSINVNGIKGKSISYLYNYQGNNLAIKTYVLPVDAAVYVLTSTCPAGDAKELNPVFSKIVDSFRVK